MTTAAAAGMLKARPPYRKAVNKMTHQVAAKCLNILLYSSVGTIPWPTRLACGASRGESVVLGRNYLTWRAATLLKLAQSIRDPNVAGALVEKAADLKSQLDQANLPDLSPRAPDVESPRSHPGDARESLPASSHRTDWS